ARLPIAPLDHYTATSAKKRKILYVIESEAVRRRAVGCIVWLGDGFILHHQNNPAALSGHTCARGSAHPTYYCRVDTMNRQLDCPRPRKGSCLGWCHW